jgi:transposase
MPGKSTLTADAAEQAALRALSKSEQRDEADRARAILLTLEGRRAEEIAAVLGVHISNLVARNSIGHVGAAQLLLTAGDNPQRLRSEAGFAALCGVSPVPASSGKTARHRLNRGGDRAANSALHIIAIGRLRTEARTQAYVAKRIGEGHSKLEAIRCLKRYIAREVFTLIKQRQKEINRTRIAA